MKPAGSSWVSGNQSHSLRFVGNIGESLQFGGDDEENNALEEEAYATAGPDTLPALAIAEASTLGEANEGEVGTHLDFGIQEVRLHSRRLFIHLPMPSQNVFNVCSLHATLGPEALRCVTSRSHARIESIDEQSNSTGTCRQHAALYLSPPLNSDLPHSYYGLSSDIY